MSKKIIMKGNLSDLQPLVDRGLLDLTEPSREIDIPGHGTVTLPEPDELSSEEEQAVEDMCQAEREALKLDSKIGRPREIKKLVRDICLVNDVFARADESPHSNEAIFVHLSKISPYRGSSPDHLGNQYYKLRKKGWQRLLFEHLRLEAAVREYLQH